MYQKSLDMTKLQRSCLESKAGYIVKLSFRQLAKPGQVARQPERELATVSAVSQVVHSKPDNRWEPRHHDFTAGSRGHALSEKSGTPGTGQGWNAH